MGFLGVYEFHEIREVPWWFFRALILNEKRS
jgi:hypothetical protein